MCGPEFIKKLNDLTVNDGEQLELSVKIRGDPEPQVTWSKNGKVSDTRFFQKSSSIMQTFFCPQPLSSSEILDLKYRGGVATLTINEVFPEDEGEFTCKATNSVGTATTSCKLTVKREYIHEEEEEVV